MIIQNDDDADRRMNGPQYKGLDCDLFSYLCWGIVYANQSRDHDGIWRLLDHEISKNIRLGHW